MDHRALDTPDDLRDRADAGGSEEPGLALLVNEDRAAVGRDALRDAEFGPRSWFHRMTKQFRSEKAKGQLRDPESKQFIEERGNLDLDVPGGGDGKQVRARVDAVPDLAPEEGDALSIPGKRTRGTSLPAPKSSPKAKVVRLEGDQMTQRLLAAGFDARSVKRFTGRGVVFEVEHDGDNPVFVFAAHPDGLTKRAMVPSANAVAIAKNKLFDFQKANAGKLKANDPAALAIQRQYQERIVAAQEAYARREKYVRSVYGSGGNETIKDYDRGMAEEAGAILAGDLKNWPPWELTRNGSPRPLMVAFDEAALLRRGETDLTQTMQGLAPTGESYFYIDRKFFRTPMAAMESGEVAPTDAETIGQHALLHEPGHVQDDRGGAWDSLDPIFADFIGDTMAEMPIPYGEDAPREWFAEMVAFSRRSGDPSLTPEQQQLITGFRNMFMLNREARADAPSTAWVSANQVWLQQAIAAVKAVPPQSPPRLPDPEKFFGKKYKLNVPKKLATPWD